MNKINKKIEYHESNNKKAPIVMVAAPVLGLISDHFGIEMWSLVIFIDMVCFMVLLQTTMRIQTLKRNRGASANE